MANPIPKGHMIRRDISLSRKFAALSPKAAVLFSMMIPHLDNHGKMNGDPMYIKSVVCPHISYLTIRVIKKCLQEIDQYTNVKVFQLDGLLYIHSMSWKEHQKLQWNKLGADHLPSHPSAQVPEKSQSSPGVVPHEVEVEVEVQREEEVEVELDPSRALPLPPSDGGGDSASQEKTGGNGGGESGNGGIPESKMALIRKAIDEGHQQTLIAFYEEVKRGDREHKDAIRLANMMGCLPLPDLELLYNLEER